MTHVFGRTAFAIFILFPLLAGAQAEPPVSSVAAESQPAMVEGSDAPASVGATPMVEAPVTNATPAEVPAPRRPLLKTTKNAQFNMPMSFEPSENALLLPNPEIDYDLTLNEGRSLRIGNVLLSDRTFVTVVRPLSEMNPHLKSLLGSEASRYGLILRWPEALMKSGTLEMISRSGTVLWKYEITTEGVDAWKKRLGEWKSALRARGVEEKQLRGGLFATQFLIEDLRGIGAPFWNQNEIFRFCLNQVEGRSQTRLCTQRFGTRTKGTNLVMGKVPSAIAPRVVVMNKNGALKASIPVSPEAPAQFYADLAGGESYEFLAMPSKLNLVDLSDTSKPNLIRVSGFGVRPTEPSLILNPDRYSALTIALGFEPTIGDTRKFWAAGLKAGDPKLHFPGEGGGLFKQRFELAEIPRASARVHMHKNTRRSTYIDGAWLTGRKEANATVTSDQHLVEMESDDPTIFYWKFKADEKAEINRSYLSVTYEGKTYKSFFELYRGYANELSARLTGIISSAGGFVFMGEIAYNHWFENWFGWDNTILTKQRWGLSGKYFKSLTPFSVAGNSSSGESKVNLDVLTVDLKYRLTPGLWTRDETVGPLVSYQQVTFSSIKAPMMGVGAFWARSMPRVFDEFFNLFPMMDYPKWVDMEFIYYVNSMNPDVKLNSTMALNFHGQVLWKKNFFGEAGFGFKRYGFVDPTQNNGLGINATLNTIYGTVGMGLKF